MRVETFRNPVSENPVFTLQMIPRCLAAGYW